MHGRAPLSPQLSFNRLARTSAYTSCTFHARSFLRFARSDELWAGLVRGVFLKVEERVAHEPNRDFIREWRVRSAKKQLIKRFGIVLIRWAIGYFVAFSLALVVLTVTGYTRRIIVELHASVASSIEAALAAVAGLVGTLTAIVLSFKLAFASSKASSLNRGEAIFNEASMVKDQLGFLDKVKQELQQLFEFLHEFEEQVGTQIVIVPIIDDLDRCLTDGRNVKVLEAVQLMLSVPGAPILSFLAVDSRIAVASIEEHHEKVFAKTNISGHEYLGKIVQVPFALPEPSPEKVERLLSKSLEGDAASPAQVAQRLKFFTTHGRRILTRAGPDQVTFKMAQIKDAPKGRAVPLESLVRVSQQFWVDGSVQKLELDSEDALNLVCAAARELGQQHLQELADRVKALKDTKKNKEEAVEMLCRAMNAAMEAGRLDFGDVHNVDMRMMPMT